MVGSPSSVVRRSTKSWEQVRRVLHWRPVTAWAAAGVCPRMPMHTHDLRQKFNKYMYHVHSAYERIKSTSLARKKFPSIRRGVFGYLRFIISSK